VAATAGSEQDADFEYDDDNEDDEEAQMYRQVCGLPADLGGVL
jgi:hypothetical protein